VGDIPRRRRNEPLCMANISYEMQAN